jgi:hypothetical protein
VPRSIFAPHHNANSLPPLAAAAAKGRVGRLPLGDKFSVVSEDTERVRASGVINNALKIGQAAPDFTLPDAFGKQVSLNELLARGPVVIGFYRGEWCP